MQYHVKKEITITLTEEEFRLLYDGIGNTSVWQRIEIGMTEEQSEFFAKFYFGLPEIDNKQDQ